MRNATRLFLSSALIVGLVASGCTLITEVDRSKIGEGGAGGDTTGDGGTTSDGGSSSAGSAGEGGLGGAG